MKTKRKSTFVNFLLNSLSFFDTTLAIYESIQKGEKPYSDIKSRAIQGSFANCNISVDLDLFNGGIIEYI